MKFIKTIKKPKYKNLCTLLRNRGATFCKESSLHSLHYIAKRQSCKTSIFWTVLCLTSLIFCFYLIYLQMYRFRNNRISTTITSTAYPVWKIPFPAVTICNFNVVYKDNTVVFANLLRQNGVENDDIENFFQNLSHLLQPQADIHTHHDEIIKSQSRHRIIKILEANNFTTEVLMRKLAHPCEKQLSGCFWQGNRVKCAKLFSLKKTASGYCCSFNYNLKEHSNFSIRGFGQKMGLTVYLDIEEAQYIAALKANFGFYVMIHPSEEYPNSLLKTSSIYFGSRLSVIINPQVIESDDDIRGVNTGIRKCLFEDEKRLMWSNWYSFSTCMSECHAAVIYKLCGCLPYYYPRTNQSRFCTLIDTNCILRSESVYENLIFDRENPGIFALANSSNKILNTDCDCLLDCNEVSYNYEAEHEIIKPTEAFNINFGVTVLNVYYNDMGCTKFARSVYFTWDTLLASIGGIFGLCLGGSILSLIEILYYVIIPYTKKEKDLRRNRLNVGAPKIYVSELLFPKTNKY